MVIPDEFQPDKAPDNSPERTRNAHRIPCVFIARTRGGAQPGAPGIHCTALHITALHELHLWSPNPVTVRKLRASFATDPEIGTLIKMATEVQIERLAGAISKLRPEWSARSLKTYLEAKHADRAFADLAVALTMIAVDPTSTTPARIEGHGPWWLATRFNAGNSETQTPGPGREPACERVGHEHELARNCRACAAERLADTAADVIPLQPAPAPARIVAVAERHRRTSAPPTGRRDFAQPEELRTNDLGGANCGRCGGYFTNDPDGRESHQAVFGHIPPKENANV